MLASINTQQQHARPRAVTANSYTGLSPTQTSRPAVGRAQSYVGDITTPMASEHEEITKLGRQDSDASTLSILPRLHLPGHKSRHSHDITHDDKHQHHLYRRHRHTRSDLPRPLSHVTNADNDPPSLLSSFRHPGTGMLTRMTSNLTSVRHQHSTSDFQPDTNGPVLYRRATSEASNPTAYNQLRPAAQTEIERLLARADRQKAQADTTLTANDEQQLSVSLAEANVELQQSLTSTTQSASSLMRRLDTAHQSLLATIASLGDTISSFQTLCEQSMKLTQNFTDTTRDLDASTRRQIEKQRVALLDTRANRVAELEKRGRSAHDRAEALSQRLENCRIVVTNYRSREERKRRQWKGIFLGTLWGFAVVMFGILVGVGVWWWLNYGYAIRLDLQQNLDLGKEIIGAFDGGVEKRVRDGSVANISELDLPTDVKRLLEDIAARHSKGVAGDRINVKERVEMISNQVSTEATETIVDLFKKLEL